MKVLTTDDSAIVTNRLVAMLSRIVEAENISYAEGAPQRNHNLFIRASGASRANSYPKIPVLGAKHFHYLQEVCHG